MASNSVFAELLRNYKLDGSNFTVWRRKIMFLLTAENIDYVVGTNEPDEPADDASDEEKDNFAEEMKEWTKDNKKARVFILGSMSDSLAGEYESEKTSYTIMKRLEEDYGICEACIMGKMTRSPFPKANRSTEQLAIVHSDICGEFSTPTLGGRKIYFITFIDDYSRYGYVYLLKHKSEGFDAFKVFKAEVENQLNKKIKVLRTDRGGEYTSGILDAFCKEHGIIHHYTLPYTPQQNGVAERRNRTLMDMVRAMMAYSDLPLSFWGEALHTAVYLLNHSPSKAVKVTPYELWKGRKPSIRHLAVWGCNAQIRVPSQLRTKLQPKSNAGIFIGYSSGSNGYRFYDPEKKKLIESGDAVFLDQDTPRRAKRARVELLVEPEDIPIRETEPLVQENNGGSQSTNSDSNSMPRRSGRNVQAPAYLDDYFVFLGEVHSKIQNIEEEPKSVKAALASPESNFWIEAMQEEFNSMRKNNVWKLVELPNNRKSIGSKWIFKRKLKSTGQVDKYSF